MSPSNEAIQRGRPPETIKSMLARPEVLDRIRAVAPKYLSPERVAKILLLTCSRDAKLMRCTPQSLLGACLRAAQAGLEVDGQLCYLVAYGDQVNLIIGWRGLLAIARRNGIEAKAVLVHANDEFRYQEDDGGGCTVLSHEINVREDRGPLIGAWSRSRQIDGGGIVDYEYMTLAQIEAVRSRSQAAKSGPWTTDFSEMARKTVLRRHSKRWPLTVEDRAATEDDDAPAEIVERRVEVTSEPARPLFKSRLGQKPVEEDDIPFDAVSPAAEREPEIEVTIPPVPEPPAAKRKAKAEQPPVTASPVEPELGLSLVDYVKTEMQTDFETFKKAVIESGLIDTAQTWKGFSDVPEDDAAKLLKWRVRLSKVIEMVKGGEA
jgi:recombination protein RecT